MKLTRIISVSLIAASMSMPLLAKAADLVTINQTSTDSTAKVNGGQCSASMPFLHGITEKCSTNTTSHRLVHIACSGNTANCTGDIYMNDDCSDTKIGTVIIDVDNSVIKTVTTDCEVNNTCKPDSYHLSKHDFTLVVTGGPAPGCS